MGWSPWAGSRLGVQNIRRADVRPSAKRTQPPHVLAFVVSEPRKVPRIEFADDFHDLCHHWWQGCDDRRLHLKHWHEFVWTPRWRSAILCRLGHHAPLGQAWRRDPFTDESWFIGWVCHFCGRRWTDPDGSSPRL